MNHCEHLVGSMCSLTGRVNRGEIPSKAGNPPPPESKWASRKCLATGHPEEQTECDRFTPMDEKEWNLMQENFTRWVIEGAHNLAGLTEEDC